MGGFPYTPKAPDLSGAFGVLLGFFLLLYVDAPELFRIGLRVSIPERIFTHSTAMTVVVSIPRFKFEGRYMIAEVCARRPSLSSIPPLQKSSLRKPRLFSEESKAQ